MIPPPCSKNDLKLLTKLQQDIIKQKWDWGRDSSVGRRYGDRNHHSATRYIPVWPREMLGRSLTLSAYPFPHLKNGKDETYLVGPLCKITCVKHLEQCLASRIFYRNVSLGRKGGEGTRLGTENNPYIGPAHIALSNVLCNKSYFYFIHTYHWNKV